MDGSPPDLILDAMRLAAALLALALPMGAQEVVTLPAGQPRPGASEYKEIGTVDSDLHANVRKLMELSGDRERLQNALPKLLDDAKAKMLKAFPSVSPAFGEEWEKRMAARINVDDFLDVAARVYEKHFSNEEILDVIAVLHAKKEGQPAKVSPDLQKKIAAEMPAIMGEIVGGTTELAARLGGQIGSEIEKEHPEYMRPKSGVVPR